MCSKCECMSGKKKCARERRMYMKEKQSHLKAKLQYASIFEALMLMCIMLRCQIHNGCLIAAPRFP